MGIEVIQCTVTYDKKAIIINGQRRILISGSIHYPRSTPDVLPSFFHFSNRCIVSFLNKFIYRFYLLLLCVVVDVGRSYTEG